MATYANWKGHDVFLDALARLPATGPTVRGYVVGGPIYATVGSQFTRDELERRAAANGLAGRVGFIPFQPDPADVYRMLDVAVHASIRPEPFGLTIVEAMACGKPVVVAAAGGAAELFTPGHDGLGHTPGDAKGLTDAIARLAADPELRARLGANARRTAVERFSQERYGREIAAVFAACLRDRIASGSKNGRAALPLGFVRVRSNEARVKMDTESMAKTVETCCRCGSPLEHDPVLILAQSGPLHSAHPVINLCPSWADSLTRWFARGQRSRPAECLETHRAIRRHIPPQTASARIAAQAEGPVRGSLAVAVALVAYSIVCIILYGFYGVACALSWPVTHGLSLCPWVASDRGAISGHVFCNRSGVGGRGRRTRTRTKVAGHR